MTEIEERNLKALRDWQLKKRFAPVQIDPLTPIERCIVDRDHRAKLLYAIQYLTLRRRWGYMKCLHPWKPRHLRAAQHP